MDDFPSSRDSGLQPGLRNVLVLQSNFQDKVFDRRVLHVMLGCTGAESAELADYLRSAFFLFVSASTGA